jgi:regulator of protease activity HflC (stomatin/prohibitin superfamily)
MMIMGAACEKVSPGWVGIKVNLYGTARGVDDMPIVTGRVVYNPVTTEIFKFPTFLQTVAWTHNETEGSRSNDEIGFNSIEGVPLFCDVGFSYKFNAERIPYLFQRFRQEADVITNTYMRSKVRESISNVAGQMELLKLMGEGKEELAQVVRDRLNTELNEDGIEIEMFSFIGRIRSNDSRVEQAINAVLQQKQDAIKAGHKVEQIHQEALQLIEEARGDSASIMIRAVAQAQANEELNRTITDRLVQWKALDVWDGIMPKVTGENVPFVTVD